MVKKVKKAFFVKSLRRMGGIAMLAVGLLVCTPQNAKADCCDWLVYGGVIAQTAQVVMSQTVSAWQQISNSVGQGMQSMTQVHLQDNNNINSRTNVELKSNHDIATKLSPDPGYDPCHDQKAADLNSSIHTTSAGIAQALTQANSNRPDSPSTAAAEITAECQFGFAPDPNTSPEGKTFALLTTSSCSSKHALMDQNINTLLEPLEYPVPPTFAKPKNGVYQLPQSPVDEKYIPFVAALMFCMNVTPQSPVLPASTTHTFYNMSAKNMINARSAASMGTSACYNALAKRMQFGQDSTGFPATDENSASAHDEQAGLCEEEHAANRLDDAKYNDCQTNGRSTLQAESDHANLLRMDLYTTNVLAKMPPESQEAERNRLQEASDAFERQKQQEMMNVSQAISESFSVKYPQQSNITGMQTN
jgi:hypothetical protein